MPDQSADAGFDVAAANLARHRAEVCAIAAAADSPRRAWPTLAAAGVTVEAMANPDTAAVLRVIRDAVEAAAPIDRTALATAAADALRAVDAWDTTDDRPFVTTDLRWGPAGLHALLTRLRYDPDLVGLAAARLADPAAELPDPDPFDVLYRNPDLTLDDPADDDPRPLVPSPNRHTDLANARRLVAAFDGTARWNHNRGVWIVYRPAAGVWADDTVGVVEQYAKGVADGMWAAIAGLYPAERKAAIRHATRSSSAGGIGAMVALARSEPGVTVTADQLDVDPWLLNVANGVVDLRTGELLPHDPDLMLTRQAPVAYDPAAYDPAARCPTFLAFIDRVMAGNADLIGYVQRLCGVIITGDISEQLLPLFIGVGANGKSVLVDTLLAMLGSYAGLAPPSLLTDRGGGEEHPTELADLIGRRLVVGSETEESARLKIQLVKRLTGDATVKARFMRCDYFEARRTFKVLLVTNNKPVVTEAGNAVWRRLRLVPFSVVIPEAEQDRNLIDKLRAEWPGILAWCVRGTLDWQRDGMRTPEAVLLATAEYAAEQDVLADYLAARTVRGGDHVRVGRSELFADYQSWASQTGERHPLNRNAFFDRVRKLPGVSDGQWRPVGITTPVRGFQRIGLAAIGGDG